MNSSKQYHAIGGYAWRQLLELLLLFGLAFVTGQAVFCDWFSGTFTEHARGFWIVPFVIWAALHFGVRETVFLLAMFFAQSLWGALNGTGFFATDLAETHLLNLALFNISAFALGLFLATAFRDRDLLYRAVDSGNDETLLFDVGSLRIRYASRAALENLGYAKADLMKLTPLDLFPEFTEQTWRILLQPLLEHEVVSVPFVSTQKHKDGRTHPVEAQLHLYERKSQRYILLIVSDVTHKRDVEVQLHTIIETAQTIIWKSDSQGEISFMSPRIKDILGVDAQAMIGGNLFDMFERGMIHQDDLEEHKRAYKDLLEKGVPISNLVHRSRCADGSWKWMSLSATPVFDSGRQLSGVIGVVHDVHAQKTSADQLLMLNLDLDRRIRQAVKESQEKDRLLQQQERLSSMGEMMGNVAHQWRQPLNSLSLTLSDLYDAYAHNECDEAYMKASVAQANAILQKMSSTIDDFIKFSRQDRYLENINLEREVEACLRLMSGALDHHQISVVVDGLRGVRVVGYENELGHVIMNILSNAKDAIVLNQVSGGAIRIESSQDGTFGILTISDNGGGIAEKDLPHIFEPYFTTKQTGVGIGLHISRNAVEKNMHGKLEVQNTGTGAQFTIRLPLVQSSQGALQ